jgi:hypothetical protein
LGNEEAKVALIGLKNKFGIVADGIPTLQ